MVARQNRLLRAFQRLRQELPEGRSLPEALWRRRHLGFLIFLLIHAAFLTVFSSLTGHTTLFSAGVGAWISLFVLLGAMPRFSRKVRASLVSLGLMTCSAFLVHLSGGYIEMHFHYFVMVTLLALYQDWTPFLLAVGYVVFQHGIGGLLFPHTVYNHPDAWLHPWKWAFIHAGFLGSSCIGVIIAWRANESSYQAIHASEERFQSVAQSANDAIVSADSLGSIISWNRGAERMFGYREEEVLGRPLTFLMPERYRAGHQKGLERMRSTGEAHVIGKTVELHGVRKDGSEFPLELSLATWKTGHETFYSGIIRDITERKRAEEALKESSEFNEQIIASAKQGIIVYDRDLKYVMWNPFMEELTGLGPHEVRGKHCLDVFPFLRDQGVYALLERALEGENGTAPNVNYSISRTGRTGWISGQYGPFHNAKGEIVGVLGIISDITERKRGEEALRESEEQFRLLVGTVRDYSIIMLDPAGHVVSWNEGAERIKGFRTHEVLGKHVSSFHTPEDIQAGKPALGLQTAADQGTFEDIGWRVRKDGTHFWANEVMTAIRDEAGTLRGYSKVTRDITERKHLEDQLRQSQKMEAIGSLAGGIAHDFNNLLMVITGYSQLLLDRLGPDDLSHADIKEIKQAGERAASLTQQLLAFSRRQMLMPELLDLNSIVAGMGNMLQRLIGENIQLTMRPGPALGMVKADRGQIEQVIMNLAVNARDAMPRGGLLTIETANVELNEARALRISLKGGAYIALSITDTGCGMDSETQARIFEPFFTTKEPGKGTGLGLSTVYGIVNQSKGSVLVESEPGKGSTFTIYLTRIKDEARLESGGAVPAGIPRGSETVLVVEDEDIVRGLLRKVLQASGYVVLEARSGQEAVWLCQDHTSPIHLLITDVVMPGMNGRELANRLAHMKPGMKVIFISGYIDDAVVRDSVTESRSEFLQKPIEPAVLMRKVREVLERS